MSSLDYSRIEFAADAEINGAWPHLFRKWGQAPFISCFKENFKWKEKIKKNMLFNISVSFHVKIWILYL